MKTLSALLLLLSSFATGQAAFRANGAGGMLSNHYNYSTTPFTQIDSRISTSTASGFTSPATVIFEHVGGLDYAITPDRGVVDLGRIRLGTGSFLSGSLSGAALFGVDQSFVIVDSNGSCGAFNPDGTCNRFTPNTASLFVGVFTGQISWSTNADHTHVRNGTVQGTVNGGSTVITRNLTATTAADANPFVANGHLNITTVTLTP